MFPPEKRKLLRHGSKTIFRLWCQTSKVAVLNIGTLRRHENAIQGRQRGGNSGPRDRPAIQSRFCDPRSVDVDRKLLKRPNRAGVKLGNGLQHADAPVRAARPAPGTRLEEILGIVDCAIVAHEQPVEGTGAGIAWRAGMHDEGEVGCVYLAGHAGREERTDDDVRLGEGRSLDHDLVGEGIFDRDVVRPTEREEELLGQGVVRGAQKEDLHG